MTNKETEDFFHIRNWPKQLITTNTKQSLKQSSKS